MNSFCSDHTRHNFASDQKPTQAAHRGTYRLPHMSQQSGRDLAGEDYAGGRRLYGVIQTTPQWRDRMQSPYFWLIRTAEIQAHTAFLSAADLLDWCSAYAVTLSPMLHRSYQTFSAEIGDPAHWLPLDVRTLGDG